jgi:hypothetical protein
MPHPRYGWHGDWCDEWEDRVSGDSLRSDPFGEIAQELHASLRLLADEVAEAVTMPLEAFAASSGGGRRRRPRRRAWRFEAWAAGHGRRTGGRR